MKNLHIAYDFMKEARLPRFHDTVRIKDTAWQTWAADRIIPEGNLWVRVIGRETTPDGMHAILRYPSSGNISWGIDHLEYIDGKDHGYVASCKWCGTDAHLHECPRCKDWVCRTCGKMDDSKEHLGAYVCSVFDHSCTMYKVTKIYPRGWKTQLMLDAGSILIKALTVAMGISFTLYLLLVLVLQVHRFFN